MTTPLDILALRKALLQIYETALAAKDTTVKDKARALYRQYASAAPLLDATTRRALDLLVDIGWQTGIEITQEQLRALIKKLRTPP